MAMLGALHPATAATLGDLLPLLDSPATSPQAPAVPPASAFVIEGENLPAAAVRHDIGAHGGAAADVTGPLSVRPELATGTYIVTARVRSDDASRIDVLASGAMAGTLATSSGWRLARAVVFLDGVDDTVGVVASPRAPGAPVRAVEVDWLALTATTAGPTVRGTGIVDAVGQPVAFYGANRPGYERYVNGSSAFNVGSSEAPHLRAWGMNAARLPLNQEFWLHDCPATTPAGVPTTYRRLVAEEVAKYVASDMFVVLALHTTSRGKDVPCTYRWPGPQQPMADERSVGFWSQVASAYRSNPMVGFDLFNEPALDDPSVARVVDPDTVWRNGGRVADPLVPLMNGYDAAGMQTLYNAVRGTGATNLVFVEGLSRGADVGVMLRRPLDGYGIVAAPHLYCEKCPDRTVHSPHHELLVWGEHTGEPDRPGAGDRFPVTATEFGTTTTTSGSYNADVIRWLAGHRAGWLVYAWAGQGTDAADPYSILAYDATVGGPRRPNASGQPVCDALTLVREAIGSTGCQ